MAGAVWFTVQTVIEGVDLEWTARKASLAWAYINTDMAYSVLQCRKSFT